MQNIFVNKDELIVRQGDPNKIFYCIISGKISIQSQTLESEKQQDGKISYIY